ncbi:GMC family oxidoreductase [bacterium]|nr:GMC family oxidoreductase [bacterium]
MDAEAIVIGSGFGGAVAALRLGEAGVRTLLLERGRRWEIKDPTANDTFATFRRPDRRAEWMNEVSKTPGYEGIPIGKYAGVLEVLPADDLTLLAGAGVGGGSLVYGGILIQPPGDQFRRVFPPEVDYDEMDRVYYPRVRSVVHTVPIPDDVLNSRYYAGLRVLLDQALAAGFKEVPTTTGTGDGVCRFPMAVDWDIVRGEIAGTKVPSVIAAEFWFGNNSGAKQTLDRDYIRRAEETGAVEVRPLHLVREVADGPAGGYRVTVDRIDETGDRLGTEELTCRYLFLAAGTLGTTRLLMKARAAGTVRGLPDGLGEGFGNDGDVFLIRTTIPGLTNPHLGGPGAVAVMNYDNPVRPCVMMRAPFPRFAQDYPKLDAIGTFVFTLTAHRGRLVYDPAADTVRVEYRPDSDEPARRLAERLNGAGGGTLSSVASRTTGHQLGGACMGVVCDDRGRVRGRPGLYVVDGALIPGSTTCVNPALTIAAIAERCLDDILARDISRRPEAV